MKQRLCCSRTE